MALTLKPHPRIEGKIATQAEITGKVAWIRGFSQMFARSEVAKSIIEREKDTDENQKNAILETERAVNSGKIMGHTAGINFFRNKWWPNGGTLAGNLSGENGGTAPEPPGPPTYAEEPPPTDPELTPAADQDRYSEGSVWKQLGTGEENLSIPRASYFIQWAGDRLASSEYKERGELAASKPEKGIGRRMWAYGWLTGPQGFTLGGSFEANAELRKVYIGIAPEAWVAQQIALNSGGGPSGK